MTSPHQQAPRRPQRQSGMALLTALIIVSTAVMVAASVVALGQREMHRIEMLQDSERAWWYAVGVEDWAGTILQADAEDSDYDGLDEIWAQPVDMLPVDQGFLTGQITDEQGLFNLNNFGVTDTKKYQEYITIFERLLSNLDGVDPYLAKTLAPAIRDWIDTDSEPTPYDGAEDSYYLQQTPPYRPANRPLQSVSELLAIKGMTPELYRKLRPYVSALPEYPTAINVNTAPEPVLEALSADPSSALKSFVNSRTKSPAKSISDLNSDGVFGSGDASTSMMSVTSSYFELQATATINNSRVAIYSLYYRSGKKVPKVIRRSTNTD